MIKGFHIPFHFREDEIISLGERLIAAGHYQWIEIKWPCNYLGVDCASYLRGIRHLVKAYPLSVSCHIPTNLDLGQTNAGMRAELVRQIKSCMDYAAEFGTSILPLHPGTIMTMDIPETSETAVKRMLIAEGERKRESARRMTVEIVQETAEYAEQYGMTIVLENLLLPQEIAHTAEDLKNLVDRCERENVKALFDCGHAHRVGADIPAFIRTLGSRIAHVHLNDNDGTCDLHLQMGEGTIPFGPLFSALLEAGYRGALVMETSYRDSGELLKSSALLDNYLKESGKAQ